MKESKYKSFDELPLILNAEMVADVLGIPRAGAYELMNAASFPAKPIRKRIIVTKDAIQKWLDTEG